MHSSVLLTAIAAGLVAADELNFYLGANCNNAVLGTVTPLEPGTCVDLLDAQSYILDKDDGVVYNLYSGGACSQYEGQVSLSGGCVPVGDDLTGIMSIGTQDAKRAASMEKRKAKERRSRTTMVKRVDGDTYQCPNIPSGADYFFVVTQSSATEEEVAARDEQIVENDFMAQFNAAYQNPSGQTQVYSETPYEGDSIQDIGIALDMQQGVIQDIQPRDMEIITADLMEFRDQQRSPINFLVSLYTGRIDNVGGLIATFNFRGD